MPTSCSRVVPRGQESSCPSGTGEAASVRGSCVAQGEGMDPIRRAWAGSTPCQGSGAAGSRSDAVGALDPVGVRPRIGVAGPVNESLTPCFGAALAAPLGGGTAVQDAVLETGRATRAVSRRYLRRSDRAARVLRVEHASLRIRALRRDMQPVPVELLASPGFVSGLTPVAGQHPPCRIRTWLLPQLVTRWVEARLVSPTRKPGQHGSAERTRSDRRPAGGWRPGAPARVR